MSNCRFLLPGSLGEAARASAVVNLTQLLHSERPDLRLEVLRELAAVLSPPEDVPPLLDQTASAAVAGALRAAEPEAVGAAAAVPLVVALMQYEWQTRDQVCVVQHLQPLSCTQLMISTHTISLQVPYALQLPA